ncbi:MAG: di-trans,poly-cis-decaprenylcistransferase [Phycisphaeraceae bacterium]|nr:MAG: di-trans,poly-cis-decaprenylcistransferase [Phycisphaeraceae bacterium]
MPGVHPGRIPRHIAVIMDGNGRWASARGLDRSEGHRAGVGSVRTALETCGQIGVECLTLYSFSRENWSRPADEVAALMALCAACLRDERDDLVAKRVRLRVIGSREELPAEVVGGIELAEAATAENRGITLCLALNYGSRAEIARAARRVAERVARGEIRPEGVTEAVLASHLDTAGLPDPDLLIRTAGEMRLSNFLLWQVSYAELYVTPVLWPDFGREDLLAAVRAYAGRSRTFGGLGNGAPAGGGEGLIGRSGIL